MQREAKLMRNQRPTRNNPMNRQFVAGGVISNFTGVPVKTEPATPTTPTTPNTPAVSSFLFNFIRLKYFVFC